MFEMFYLIYCVFMLLPTFPYSRLYLAQSLSREKLSKVSTSSALKIF